MTPSLVEGFVPLVIVLFAVAAVGGVTYELVRRRRKASDLQRLLTRDPTLVTTATPCGLDPRRLATGFAATPRGDRSYGIQYGVTGPLTVSVAGTQAQVEVAAFRWWWQVARRRFSNGAHRTHYERNHTTVAAVRLAAVVPDHLVIRPESMLGRVGLTRGGHQLESSEFNRRFRVEGRDRTLTVTLLDARLQELLTTAFPGRTVEIAGDLLLLAGSPTHRDSTLTGVIGELPAVRQDATRLLQAVPAAFWRAVAAATRSEA